MINLYYVSVEYVRLIKVSALISEMISAILKIGIFHTSPNTTCLSVFLLEDPVFMKTKKISTQNLQKDREESNESYRYSIENFQKCFLHFTEQNRSNWNCIEENCYCHFVTRSLHGVANNNGTVMWHITIAELPMCL